MKYVLYFYISTCRSVCAVPNTAVLCRSLISRFAVMLLSYCVSDSERVPAAHVIYGISFAWTLNMRCISIKRSLYFITIIIIIIIIIILWSLRLFQGHGLPFAGSRGY